jgi:hypothetical protein
LVLRAIALRSTDNVSVVVIKLNGSEVALPAAGVTTAATATAAGSPAK